MILKARGYEGVTPFESGVCKWVTVEILYIILWHSKLLFFPAKYTLNKIYAKHE